MSQSTDRSKGKRRPPPRRANAWERVSFQVPPDLKVGLERMVSVYGESQGAFLRFLIRQELKGFIQKNAPSVAP